MGDSWVFWLWSLASYFSANAERWLGRKLRMEIADFHCVLVEGLKGVRLAHWIGVSGVIAATLIMVVSCRGIGGWVGVG